MTNTVIEAIQAHPMGLLGLIFLAVWTTVFIVDRT